MHAHGAPDRTRRVNPLPDSRATIRVASEDHLNNGAVVIGWTSRAEVGHALENALQAGANGGGVEPLVAEEIAVRILRFRNAVTD